METPRIKAPRSTQKLRAMQPINPIQANERGYMRCFIGSLSAATLVIV